MAREVVTELRLGIRKVTRTFVHLSSCSKKWATPPASFGLDGHCYIDLCDMGTDRCHMNHSDMDNSIILAYWAGSNNLRPN